MVKNLVQSPEKDTIDFLKVQLKENLIGEDEQGEEHGEVKALIIEELNRLHPGVLTRYGLRPSEFKKWKQVNSY